MVPILYITEGDELSLIINVHINESSMTNMNITLSGIMNSLVTVRIGFATIE